MIHKPLLRCGNHTSSRTAQWLQALRETGDENVFNPSLARSGGAQHLAYRAFGPDGSRPFRALLLSRPDPADPGGAWTRTDLTAHAAEHGVDVVADPKLVVLGEELYATFNSGFSATRNEVHLMRVHPRLGPPQRCVLADRQAVEKNWAFFTRDGVLSVLYGLRPLVVLEHTGGVLGSSDEIRLSRRPGVGAAAVGGGLTIGTQPAVDGEDLLLVAHEKVYLRGKRGYAGRPVRVRDVLGPAPEVVVGGPRLVHSLTALVPRGRPRHNPNLLFATYFSGLQLEGERTLLGYGINDTDPGIADVRTRDLWP